MLFTTHNIGKLSIKNRFVCSATQDNEVDVNKQIQPQTLQKYETLARENVGMIITGGVSAVKLKMIDESIYDYEMLHIEGIEKIPKIVHETAIDCKVIAQLSQDPIYFVPSEYISPWRMEGLHICNRDEILFIEQCFIKTAIKMRDEGYDGIQLHCAHGGLLSHFMSPHSNNRTDDYGGNTRNRCRIVSNIIEGVKEVDPDFVVMIKMNCTEHFEDGMNAVSLQESVSILEDAKIDAIEFSGGMWEAIMLSDGELGFPAVPALESHTMIQDISKQTYYRSYIENINISVPVILVGGNKNYTVMEQAIKDNVADFVALCRPLICEPDLITKWKRDHQYKPICISCNTCIYDMFMHPGFEEVQKVHCLYQMSKQSSEWNCRFKEGVKWIKNWKSENI